MARGVFSISCFFVDFFVGFFDFHLCLRFVCVAGVACCCCCCMHTWHNVVASWRHISFQFWNLLCALGDFYIILLPFVWAQIRLWFRVVLPPYPRLTIHQNSYPLHLPFLPYSPCKHCLFMVMGLRNKEGVGVEVDAQAVVASIDRNMLTFSMVNILSYVCISWAIFIATFLPFLHFSIDYRAHQSGK